MQRNQAWREAQSAERGYWQGVIGDDSEVLRVLAENARRARELSAVIPGDHASCLEVGAGPLGVGVVAFLAGIRGRFALDPLSPLEMDRVGRPGAGLRDLVHELRKAVAYVVGRGEEVPIRSSSVDLAICCNVVDHTSDPDAVLRELHRVLKPAGRLFFEVNTFSVLGLLKWHSWTKYRRGTEILVRAHPWQSTEATVAHKLQASGFRLRKLNGHTRVSALVGHARASVFLAERLAS